MHFTIWSRGARVLKDVSMISITIPVVQCSHTCIRYPNRFNIVTRAQSFAQASTHQTKEISRFIGAVPATISSSRDNLQDQNAEAEHVGLDRVMLTHSVFRGHVSTATRTMYLGLVNAHISHKGNIIDISLSKKRCRHLLGSHNTVCDILCLVISKQPCQPEI